MEDRYRDPNIEARLRKFNVHYHVEDKVLFTDIAYDANPARWEERFDDEHMKEIALAIANEDPVPALLLYKPPGAHKYRSFGGRHRSEAAITWDMDGWPAYVLDEPLDEFLIEALPIFDNVGGKKSYTKRQRLEFAAHLLAFKDRDDKMIAAEMQLKPDEIAKHVDLVRAMNRAHDLGISADTVRKLPPIALIKANKSLPIDAVFKAAVETLAFTEMTGYAADGLIKDIAAAKSEAAALAKLTEIYEKHRLELERRKRGGKKSTPTLAQKIKKCLVTIEGLWPGRVELLEIAAHDDEFIAILEESCKKAREIENEMIDRCAEVRFMREKSRSEREKVKPGAGATP